MHHHHQTRHRHPSVGQFSSPKQQYSEQRNKPGYIRPVNPIGEAKNLRPQFLSSHDVSVQISDQGNVSNQNFHPRPMMNTPPRLRNQPTHPQICRMNLNQEQNMYTQKFRNSQQHEESTSCTQSNFLKQNINMHEPFFSQNVNPHQPWHNTSAECRSDISQRVNPSPEMIHTIPFSNFRSTNPTGKFQSTTYFPENRFNHPNISSHSVHQLSVVERDFEQDDNINNAVPDQNFATEKNLSTFPSFLPSKQYQHSNFTSDLHRSNLSQSTSSEQHISNYIQSDIENRDKIWLKNWLKSKLDQGRNIETSRLLIPEAKSLLKGTISMLRELKETLKKIKENEKPEHVSIHFKKAGELKIGLDEMKKVIGISAAHDVLKQRAIRAKKKRERLKRKRKKQYEEMVEAMAKRKQLHSVIDIWQEGIANKVLEEKREKELKTIADKTLAEVRHKTTDIKKSLDVLQSLRKLRSVRKDSKERKGLYTSKESDHMFEARLRMLTEFQEKQLQTYEAEKSMIQVMLDTEQAECQEYEQEEIKRSKEEKERQAGKNIQIYLFGKETVKGPPSPTHPLYNFYMYYDAANHSVDNLCAIRHEWDQFLVNEYSSEGSTVPSTWITPSKPSSELWASALKS